MAKLTARINGVAYDLREAEGTDARNLAEKWAGFAKQGMQTWLNTEPRMRVWVDWAKVVTFEVSEALPY